MAYLTMPSPLEPQNKTCKGLNNEVPGTYTTMWKPDTRQLEKLMWAQVYKTVSIPHLSNSILIFQFITMAELFNLISLLPQLSLSEFKTGWNCLPVWKGEEKKQGKVTLLYSIFYFFLVLSIYRQTQSFIIWWIPNSLAEI